MDATEISGHMSSESILHTFNHVYFASLVRGLRDNVDNTHVENCKFAIKSGCTWAQQFSSTGHPLVSPKLRKYFDTNIGAADVCCAVKR